jgi:outer membrane immunogenic protein
MCKYLAAPAATLALTVGFAGAASAADMPAPEYTKAPPPVIWTWTGFYIGADAGGAWSKDVVSPTVADGGSFPRSNTLQTGGMLGGGTLGYNFQTGSFVYGIESDLGYMQLGYGYHQADQGGGTEVDFVNGGFYADVTGRIGYAVDHALIYGKAGWAYFGGTATTTTALPGFTWSNSGAFNGWTAGGGIEYQFTPRWSVKAEYLHFDFGSATATITGAAGVFPYKNSLTTDTVKMGINYRFW